MTLLLQMVVVAYFTSIVPAKAGSLLPNGEQTFLDNNGQVLSAGCVYFYIPGTFTPKDTYQDAGQTVTNTNPVQLDAAGRAIIYGTGTYRQIVKSSPCGSLGVQIWDQLTAATDTSNTIFAGFSAGTPNAITVTAAAFSGVDGQVINYISTNTNTGGATLNPSGFGAVPIVRDSATGPQALTGGELVATNAVSVIYDATAGTFHILSPVNWPTTGGVPVGTTIIVRGFVAPTNYAFTYGQAVSRVTFSSLFSTLTSQQTGSLSSGSPTISGLADILQFGNGMVVEAVGIPSGTTITGCTGTSCTMSANATATRTGTITFFAYGNGDGSTTFNLPDDRGATFFARTNMGGPDSGNLSASNCGASPNILGAGCGSQSSTLVASNLPPITSTNASQAITVTTNSGQVIPATDSATPWLNLGAPATGSFTSIFRNGASPGIYNYSSFSGSNSISVTSTGTTSAPISRIPPARITNYAIRLTP